MFTVAIITVSYSGRVCRARLMNCTAHRPEETEEKVIPGVIALVAEIQVGVLECVSPQELTRPAGYLLARNLPPPPKPESR